MTNVTVEQVLACDDRFTALDLALRVPDDKVTPADVLACKFKEAALQLALRVPYHIPTPADVLACQFKEAALYMAYRVPANSATPADVLSCQFGKVASVLKDRVPVQERPDVLATHDRYELRIWGQDPANCRVTAGCRAIRGIDAALWHWCRDDERARLFTRAIREWAANVAQTE